MTISHSSIRISQWFIIGISPFFQIEQTQQRDEIGSSPTRRKRHGWPGGRHASPTELKMRSGITTFSVKFATFPANQSFRTTAESMRPRAKSFIRSMSQIEANRQKFSLSMTSEVRKCPKSAKSGRKSGFLLGAVKRGGEGFEMYKWNVRSDYAVRICLYGMTLNDVITFIFHKNVKTSFFRQNSQQSCLYRYHGRPSKRTGNPCTVGISRTSRSEGWVDFHDRTSSLYITNPKVRNVN